MYIGLGSSHDAQNLFQVDGCTKCATEGAVHNTTKKTARIGNNNVFKASII